MCGEGRILLNRRQPERILRFPEADDLTRLLMDSELRRASQDAANGTREESNDTSTFSYVCYWVIATDSQHAVGAVVDFDAEDGYILTARDDRGFSKNCTHKHCEIDSSSSALTIEFRSRQIDSLPTARFSAKLFSTSIRKESHLVAKVWWIILLVLFAILIVVASLSYLFYMKRKHLLSRIFRLLRNSDGGAKSEQSRKKIVTLANGTQVCISNCRRQHRTSVTSSHLSHFEPMPTIHEEEDAEFENCPPCSESPPSPQPLPVCKAKPVAARKVLPVDKSFAPRTPPATSCGYTTVVDIFMLERAAVC